MIKYGNNINLIGIEFEGLYQPDLLEEIEGDSFFYITNDNSISRITENDDCYNCQEIKTKPLNENEINKVIKLFSYYQKKDFYRINETCGLHFHISLKKQAFGSVCHRDFYNSVVEMIKKKYPAVYEERAMKRHCRVADVKDDTFQKSSYCRYRAVQYSIETSPIDNEIKQETVEVRLYGGSKATIKELGRVIQQVIKIINQFVATQRNLNDLIEVETGKKPLFMVENLKYQKIDQQYIFKKSDFYSYDYRIKTTKKLPVFMTL